MLQHQANGNGSAYNIDFFRATASFQSPAGEAVWVDTQRFDAFQQQGAAMVLVWYRDTNSVYTGAINYTLAGFWANCGGSVVTYTRVATVNVINAGTDRLFIWQAKPHSYIAGFDLFAGSHQLNRHRIPTHRSGIYQQLVHWNGHGPYALRVLLKDGNAVRVRAG